LSVLWITSTKLFDMHINQCPHRIREYKWNRRIRQLEFRSLCSHVSDSISKEDFDCVHSMQLQRFSWENIYQLFSIWLNHCCSIDHLDQHTQIWYMAFISHNHNRCQSSIHARKIWDTSHRTEQKYVTWLVYVRRTFNYNNNYAANLCTT
jgi:hypothetical protein